MQDDSLEQRCRGCRERDQNFSRRHRPPREFLRRLRQFCTSNSSLLIADEVQCGFGRTGTLFAIEQAGVEPDILVSAKSIAAGMPLAATTGRAAVMDKAHVGGIGGTYG